MAVKKQSVEIEFDNQAQPTANVFRKQWVKGFKPKGERFKLPSQTIPDSSMSIKVMLERTKRGLPVNSGRQQPVWNGEKLLPDWKKLDLIDRARLVEKAKEDVKAKEAVWKKQKARVDAQLAEAKRIREERQKQENEKVVNEALQKLGTSK